MRLLFLLSTGLGDTTAEAGEIVTVTDPRQAQELLVTGRAEIAGEAPASPADLPEQPAPVDLPKPRKGGKS